MRNDIRTVFVFSMALITLYIAAVVSTVVANDTQATGDSSPCAFDGNGVVDHNTVRPSCKKTGAVHSDSDRIEDQEHKQEAKEVYESQDVEWCRRRPTWRRTINDSYVGTDAEIRKKCQKIIGYEPDLEALTATKDPILSSKFDPAKWELDEEYRKLKEEDFPEDDEDNPIVEEGYHDLPVLERPMMKHLESCMDRELAEMPPVAPSSSSDAMPKPRVSALHRRSFDGMPVLAVVENALSEEEARAVEALATCLKQKIPKLFELRNFEKTIDGGGNDVTFLAGFLQLLAPGVGVQVQKTARAVYEVAGWKEHFDHEDVVPVDVEEFEDEDGENVGPLREETSFSTSMWPDPLTECGIRTTEHLGYNRWKGLSFHEDADSDYTVLVALSDPDDYEGGAFSLCPDYDGEAYKGGDNTAVGSGKCPNKITVKPNRLAAIVFVSEFSHGVEPILSTGRFMFTNELWRYGHVSALEMRPGPGNFVLGSDDDDDYWGPLEDGGYQVFEEDEFDDNAVDEDDGDEQ